MDSERLLSLEISYLDKEIEEVVKELPNGKWSHPSRFINECIKKCWHIIANDIKDLIQDFYDGKLFFESINSCFIAVIPKNECPTTPADFMWISLLIIVLKIITKLLANGLKK
jgi:hypothetical protein